MRKSGLSSAWTFMAKFVFPSLWISAFGITTVLLWLGRLHDETGADPPPELKFIFLGMWIAGSAFILWASAGLKRVRIDERQLVVSNYFREISIPCGAIVDVRQNRWLNSRPITIYLREATELGDRVTFIPKSRLRIRFWRADPVVDELKRLAGLIRDI